MNQSRYFQDELEYLRRAGAQFAEDYPGLSRFLADGGKDPDVERLLEGVAFLTGRLREKIDDQLPELYEGVLRLLWPNFLQPIPSMCTLKFNPVAGQFSESTKIFKGTAVDSRRAGEKVSRFTVAHDLDLTPLMVERVNHVATKEASRVAIEISNPNGAISKSKTRVLTFFLGRSANTALTMLLWFERYLKSVEISLPTLENIVSSANRPRCCGYEPERAVLPYPDNAFVGYRLLQEFYAFSEKFYYVELELPDIVQTAGDDRFTLHLTFDRPMPAETRVDEAAFQLNCVPSINLFPHDAEPILYDGRQDLYPVIPSNRLGRQYEVFSIDRVLGGRSDPADPDSEKIPYERFESFFHEVERQSNRRAAYYRERLTQRRPGGPLTHRLGLVREDTRAVAGFKETLSLELSCTNGDLPCELGLHDLTEPGENCEPTLGPTNVTTPTTPVYPVLDGILQWNTLSCLSLNYLSLNTIEGLRAVLSTFDVKSRVDRQRQIQLNNWLDSIKQISSSSVHQLFKGRPIRGVRTRIVFDEDQFGDLGLLHLFGKVLSEFFRLYVTVNAYHELEIVAQNRGEVFEYGWLPVQGVQPLI